MKSERSTRILLEALQWPSNVFVTLTYRDNTMPWTSADGTGAPTLVPSDTQLFMKRLLKKASQEFGWKQRMWLVGEYGDRTWRPHYHAAFFNFPACQRGGTLRSPTGRFLWLECCPVCQLVGYAWGNGDIGIGPLDENRARYLGGYIEKKLTKGGDVRLDGRHPEFSRQSRGGKRKGSSGIGASAVPQMVQALARHSRSEGVQVPAAVRIQGKLVPLGRYMRTKIRELSDVDEVEETAKSDMAWQETVLPMLEAARENKTSVKAEFAKANQGFLDRLQYRRALYLQKKGRNGL